MTAPQDPYSDPGGGPGDSGGYPGGPGGPGGPAPRLGAQIFSIMAIVCGVLAVLFVPILFGPIGVILAIVGNRRGEPLWKVGLGAALAGMALGILLGYLVGTN
jgi:hypothetical protein